MPSIARNPSGTLRRLFAESSNVLSNHCVADVIAGFSASIITYLDSDAIRSLLIGFLLYAIAEDPICVFSNGSSISLSVGEDECHLKLMRTCGDSRQHIQHSRIHFS